LIIRSGSVLDFVCAFLAILEVVKQRVVSVFQNRMFGDIVIRPNDEAANGGTAIV
jgi:segregation and condensation protein A